MTLAWCGEAQYGCAYCALRCRQRPPDRVFPAGVFYIARLRIERRREGAVALPALAERFRRRAEAGGEAGEVGGPERGGLEHLGAVDGSTEDVGEELQHPV